MGRWNAAMKFLAPSESKLCMVEVLVQTKIAVSILTFGPIYRSIITIFTISSKKNPLWKPVFIEGLIYSAE